MPLGVPQRKVPAVLLVIDLTELEHDMAADKTLFAKIADREIPADIIYEDDQCLAFNDINPQAPVHVLVIPRKPVASVAALDDEDAALAGHLLIVIRDLARKLGLDNGFRVVANSGRDGGQTVEHLHFHLLGKRNLSWPPG